MTNKLVPRTVAALFAAAVLLAIVPTPSLAQAGNGQLAPGDFTPPATFRVDLDSPQIKIPYTYSYNTPLVGPSNAVFSTVTVNWDSPACDAKGLVFGGSFTQILGVSATPGTGGTTYSAAGTGTFTVQASQDAPGETAINCKFVAKVAGTQVVGAAQMSVPVILHVAYRGLLSANVPTTIAQNGPQKNIQYTIDINNLGNSESNVNFVITDKDTKQKDGWQPIEPAPIILTSANKGGTTNSATVNFVISTPYKNGWNNKETTFQLTIQPLSTKDTSDQGKGTPISVSMLARVRGVYVPGPDVSLVMLVAVGAALLARMARKD